MLVNIYFESPSAVAGLPEIIQDRPGYFQFLSLFKAIQVIVGDTGPAGKLFDRKPAALAQFSDTITDAPGFHFLENNDVSVNQVFR
jgi:hypothetical protein